MIPEESAKSETSTTVGRDRGVTIVGAGLAGTEAALQLAHRGVSVRLFEMKPQQRTPAHQSDCFAELVCSNSFRSGNVSNAVGQLKREMDHVGSHILAAARRNAVPAGDALATDRKRFAADITRAIESHPAIEIVHQTVEAIPVGPTIIATGPLTDAALADAIAGRAGQSNLSFYDAIAPIIDAESIDWQVVWRQSRYDKGDDAAYANIPLDELQYHAFINAVTQGERVAPHAFEEPRYFEGCLPIEVMIERGPLTLAHGPMKPVGLTDPRTGKRCFAVAQLRMENREASAWNMVGFQTRLKRGDQKRIFRMLPGLERAEFLRYGGVHRNTYLESPTLLGEALAWHDDPNLWFAGQITGVEGYVESTACGLLVAWNVQAALGGFALPPPPPTTALGALYRHLRGDGLYGRYSPTNINWSLVTPIERLRRERKAQKRLRLAERAQHDLVDWWHSVAPRLGDCAQDSRPPEVG